MSGAPTYDLREVSLPPAPAHIHFVGIGGIGVSGVARIALGMGYLVSGSDTQRSAATDELVGLGARVMIGHQEKNIGAAELVVMTAAARDDNPELIEARRAGIPIIKRAAMLGLLSASRACVAVAGTHGKSTTSGMATLALERAGFAPSFAVGATVRELETNAALGSGPHFVVEADEYDFSFLWLRPNVAIVTNIEYDHPDIFPDLSAVVDAFERFRDCIVPSGTLVIRADDPGCRELLARTHDAANQRVVTFGVDAGDWRLLPGGGEFATAAGPDGERIDLPLGVPGRHNQLNALAIIAAGEALGVEPRDLAPGLGEFRGVSRRFEVLLDTPARTVIDDYAHHPTEIAATLAAARERYPGRRLVAVFQPHTYSRTLALVNEFAAALDRADVAIVAEIYPSRETDSLGVASADIAAKMQRPAAIVASPGDAVERVRSSALPGDVILVMGAGDITSTAIELAKDATR